jgi:UMF1 family MFS transporter
MVGLFAPVEKSGEFFGFWGLAGKAAYAVGPLLFGEISSRTGSQRLAILSTAAFFLLGFAVMLTVDAAAGRRAAEEWDLRERARDEAT